jgi:hypothetical protein
VKTKSGMKGKEIMRIKVGGLAVILGAAALCFSVPGFGQVNMTITGANDGSYPGGPLGGFYTGTIGTATGQNIVCDDDNDDIGVPYSWKATELNASQIPAALLAGGGNLAFGGINTPPLQTIGVIGYAEVATLMETMFNPATTPAERDEISGAVWYITSGGTAVALDPISQAYVDGAVSQVGSSVIEADALLAGDTNLFIYSPVPPRSSQEFWSEYNVPEGGSAFLYLLFAGVACFGAMRFKTRNQLAS